MLIFLTISIIMKMRMSSALFLTELTSKSLYYESLSPLLGQNTPHLKHKEKEVHLAHSSEVAVYVEQT